MNKKILFFDIDGTLVDSYHDQHVINESVLNELKRIHELGHYLFICSGRPRAMINEHILKGCFDGMVLANGGYVEINNESIYEELMDYTLAKKTVDLLDEVGCDYMLETATSIYNDRRYNELYEFFGQFNQAEMFIRDFNQEEVLHHLIKLEANVLDQDREKIENAIQEGFGYSISYDQHGTDNAFELYSPTLSKAKGISKVLDYYQLSQEDTYAFGDGYNDIEMIQYCQVGVAMGNSVEALKEVSDIICDSIENDGLAKILKELF